MTRNLGRFDRLARASAGGVLVFCAALAPMSVTVRILAFGAPAAYMLFTALKGSCLGYRLMGVSSCPISKAPQRP